MAWTMPQAWRPLGHGCGIHQATRVASPGHRRGMPQATSVAGILGISVQAVHQGLLKGIVQHQLVNGRKKIDPHRLVDRWKGFSPEVALAQRCNAYLDCKIGRAHV